MASDDSNLEGGYSPQAFQDESPTPSRSSSISPPSSPPKIPQPVRAIPSKPVTGPTKTGFHAKVISPDVLQGKKISAQKAKEARKKKREETAEKVRLLYVAMTRALRQLEMSHHGESATVEQIRSVVDGVKQRLAA